MLLHVFLLTTGDDDVEIVTNKVYWLMQNRVLVMWAMLIALLLLLFAGDVMAEADGISKVVGNISDESKASYDGLKVIAGIIGFIMVIAALVLFASHKQGKTIVTPILLLIFGGALVAAPFFAEISTKTTTDGDVKTVDALLGNG